uniref:Terminase small subunit n=1 Tax=Klebsiella phage KpTRp1 TaxID=3236632 RepID=A0AB39AJ54_9CAUD
MARPLNEFGVTEQQEKFCRVFVETGNASEAYRQAYNAKNMGANTIAVKASNLLDKDNITVRLQQLREVHQKRHAITVDTLLEKLNTVFTTALAAETPQSSAAVQAVMGQAKLLGLDKQLIELSGEVGIRKTLDDFYGD